MKNEILAFLLMILLVQAQLEAWETKASMPRGEQYGPAITVLGDWVFFVYKDIAQKYQGVADQWTTITPSPTQAFRFAGATNGPSTFLVVGGKTAPSVTVNTVEQYNINTDVWITRESLPVTNSDLSATSDTTTTFVSGGTLASTSFYTYNGVTWTTKASLPLAHTYHGSTAIAEAVFAMGNPGSSSNTLSKYSVPLDVWTTKTECPNDRSYLYGSMPYYDGSLYVSGFFPFPRNLFERYDINQDSWTTLSLVAPSSHVSSLTVMLGPVLLVIGQFPGIPPPPHKIVEGYQLLPTATASVVGDPLFTSFGGVITHLHLWPGVFNLLTSPSMIVNIAIERLPSLPPEEDHVVTMMGVAYFDGATAHLAYCSVQPGPALHAHCATRSLPPSNSGMVPRNSAPTFTIQGLTINVQSSVAAVQREGGGKLELPELAHLDLFVSTRDSLVESAGLMVDLDSRGISEVTSSLSEYELPDGCIFGVGFARSRTPSHPMLDFC